MRKFLSLLCGIAVISGFTGCSAEKAESISDSEPSSSAAPTVTESIGETAEPTTEHDWEKVDGTQITEGHIYEDVAENVRRYDLNDRYNSAFLRDEEYKYFHHAELADYGDLTDEGGKIRLIAPDGTERVLVDNGSDEDPYHRAKVDFHFGEDKFIYSLCSEWGTCDCGVYDLKTDTAELFPHEEGVWLEPLFLHEGVLFMAETKDRKLVDICTADPDTLHVIHRELDLSERGTSHVFNLSSDGKRAAVYSVGDTRTEHRVTIYDLHGEGILQEFDFTSDKEYGSAELVFHSETELFLYADRVEDDTHDLYMMILD